MYSHSLDSLRAVANVDNDTERKAEAAEKDKIDQICLPISLVLTLLKTIIMETIPVLVVSLWENIVHFANINIEVLYKKSGRQG